MIAFRNGSYGPANFPLKPIRSGRYMHYEVIFDFLSKGPIPWSFIVVLAFMISAGLMKWSRSTNKEERRFGMHWLSGVLLLGGSMAWAMQQASETMRNEYQAGRFSTITGTVTNLRSGFKAECFNVEQIQFCYSDYVLTGGFNQTVNHGGPIREGLPVRISYIAITPNGEHNVILRLEAGKS